jgi:phage shock protein PspC (stress-responsive transcriptional regulator)
MYANTYETGEFTMNVVTNTNSRVKGTFSGALEYYNIDTQQVESVTVTEGSFDLSR